MSIERNIAILGAGNMGAAMIRGLIETHTCTPERIHATGLRPERIAELHESYGIEVGLDNRAAARWADVVVLATKPQVFPRVLGEIAEDVSAETLVISIAAGVSTAIIEARLAAGVRVVRAMPNTPATIGAGATVLSSGSHAGAEDLALAERIFAGMGDTMVLDESLMDAVTGLSGSGPAYVFLIIDALADGGVKVGLQRERAQRLAVQTVLGSAKLMLETGAHPGLLKDMVTSPGGAAIAGLHTLEVGGLRPTLINAVETACLRSAELGRQVADDC